MVRIKEHEDGVDYELVFLEVALEHVRPKQLTAYPDYQDGSIELQGGRQLPLRLDQCLLQQLQPITGYELVDLRLVCILQQPLVQFNQVH